MATFRKRGNRWRVELSVNGIRASASFDTKSEAQAWAALKRTELLDNKSGVKDVTVSDLLSDYAEKVSSQKRGERWELIRIKAIQQMPIAKVRLPKLSAKDIAAWRDERLKVVSGATVNREWTLLSNVFTVAVNEWRYYAHCNFLFTKIDLHQEKGFL